MRVADLVRRRGRQDAGAGDDDGRTAVSIAGLRCFGARGWTARSVACAAPAFTMSSAICWRRATSGLKRRAGNFDRVLVDAPCTGTGTWRRNPDARLRLAEADLAELLPKQAAILDQAATLVRIGGRLVYATCSLLPEENEAQVTAFLARHPGFSLVPLERAWPLGAVPMRGDFLC